MKSLNKVWDHLYMQHIGRLRVLYRFAPVVLYL